VRRPAILGVLLALSATSACTVEQGKDPCTPADLSGCILEEVAITGAEQTDPDDALESIATAPSSHPLAGVLEGVPVLGVFDTLGVEYERFDRFVLERDLQRVERWLRARGHYEARVTAGRVTAIEGTEALADGPRVRVEIVVVEGRPVVVSGSQVEVTSDWTPADRAALAERGVTPAEVERVATRASRVLLPARTFDEARYDEAKKRITRALADLGFAYVKVEGKASIDLHRHLADVVFRVDTGPPCTFGEVRVDGAGEVPTWAVLEAVDIAPGDDFSVSAMENAEAAIADLDAFGAIAVTPVLPAEGEPRSRVVPVQFSVTPSALRSIRTGFGAEAGDRVAARGFAGWENRNTLGAFDAVRPGHGLDRLTLDARPRLVLYPLQLQNLDAGVDELVPEIGLRARYGFPLRFEPRTTLFTQGELNVGLPVNAVIPDDPHPGDNILGYREIVGRVGLERRFYPMRLLVRPSFNVLREDPFSYNLPELPEGLTPLTIRYVGLFLDLDLRRNRRGDYDPIEVDHGLYAAVDVQVAGLGGDADDVRLRPEVRGYVPFTRRLVLATRLGTGLLFTRSYGGSLDAPIPLEPLRAAGGDDDELLRRPITRELQILQLRGLFSGGPNSNRGYGYNEIGPQRVLDDDGGLLGTPIAVGGRTLWEASAELRIAIRGAIGMVVFVDASDVTLGVGDYRLDHPHVASGVGFRYDTPVGPLRLDLGLRVPGLQAFGELGEGAACVETDRCGVLIVEDAQPGDVLGAPMAIHIAIGDAF
jgi:outer membrane protein insertion porin family/translocation and assembly module TamA